MGKPRGKRPVTAATLPADTPARIDPQSLTAPQLLRVVLSTPKVWERWAVCSRCGALGDYVGYDADTPRPCFECDKSTSRPLGAAWWAKAAARMRTACRRDRRLVPALKAERQATYGNVPLPAFPPPFDWLNRVWKTTSARGRPLASTEHYELAHAVERLRLAGVSMNQVFKILSEADPVERQKLYDRLPAASLRFLGEAVRAGVAELPFVSSRQELKRRVDWARRQWTEPLARLSGERVRTRRRRAERTSRG